MYVVDVLRAGVAVPFALSAETVTVCTVGADNVAVNTAFTVLLSPSLTVTSPMVRRTGLKVATTVQLPMMGSVVYVMPESAPPQVPVTVAA